MKNNYASALLSGWPHCEWSLYNSNEFSTLEWTTVDVPQPTLDEVNAKIIELDVSEAKRLLRLKRNNMLRETDVKSLPDYPHKDEESRAAWFAYRQSLRDLLLTAAPLLNSNHELDEESVEWPIEPK